MDNPHSRTIAQGCCSVLRLQETGSPKEATFCHQCVEKRPNEQYHIIAFCPIRYLADSWAICGWPQCGLTTHYAYCMRKTAIRARNIIHQLHNYTTAGRLRARACERMTSKHARNAYEKLLSNLGLRRRLNKSLLILVTRSGWPEETME